MQSWHQYSADQRFDLWLDEWRQFHPHATIGAQLAVLETLASMIPDGPLTVLDELALWATECGIAEPWQVLRHRFECELWGALPGIVPDFAALPGWYTHLFYMLPLPYRRAAFLRAFLDFMVAQLGAEAAPFQPLREWLAAVARWSRGVDILTLGATLELPSHHPMRRTARTLPPQPNRSAA